MNTLVIGYGNPLRGDDGTGWQAAELVAMDPRAAGVTVLRRHQLTPELAEDVSQADLVVLIDASSDGSPPGSVTTTVVGRTNPPTGGTLAWTHHLDPDGLIGLAANLYGQAPPVVLLRVALANQDAGTSLSPEVHAAMAQVVHAVFGIIDDQESPAKRRP